jgi:cyclophilin family peptidyl-prolyl cis-trans isomerase/HEAT repeat protein
VVAVALATAVAGAVAPAAAGGEIRTDLAAHTTWIFGALDRWWLDTPRAVGLIRDPYPEARVLAARVLANNPDASRLRLLEEYVADSSPWVRQMTLIAAGRLGPAGVEVALTGLDDKTPLVRQAAVWAAAHGGARSFEALTRVLLMERDQAVRETALGNMWRFGDAGWEAHVSRYAAHEDPILRRAAAFSLGRSRSTGRSAALMTLCRDSEPVIRATALSGLAAGPLNAAERGLVFRALTDADWRVQAAACRVLAARPELEPPEGSRRLLADLWQHRRAQLAVSALEAAGSHPEVGDDAELVRLTVEAEPWPAAGALESLARRSPETAVDLVDTWRNDDLGWRRRAAARAAAHLEGPERATRFTEILDDGDPAVRLALLEAITGRSDGDVEMLWSVVGSDGDPAVRAQALEHLREAGEANDFERLLTLYDRWSGDAMADARAAALAAALAATEDARGRERVLELAADDPDSAVSALVTAAARKAGLETVTPERQSRHGEKWYEDLSWWSDIERWLDVVTVRGTFRIRLSSDETPITAREVWDLAREGFYDGLGFHRVVPNFVVQGGDPRGDGWGGAGFSLPDEPTLRPFDSWRVGIATSGPNTGSCQFFVTLMPADHLAGHYTNFGEVVAGRDVLGRLQVGDRIVRIETVEGDDPPPITPVILDRLEWRELGELEGWESARSDYRPGDDAIARLRTVRGEYRVLTVLGTWCSDSAREVPRLQRVLEEVGPDHFEHVMVGVDRSRRIGDPSFPVPLVGGNTVERVPTIVVVDGDGVELGRIVETAEQRLEELLAVFVGPAEGWE